MREIAEQRLGAFLIAAAWLWFLLLVTAPLAGLPEIYWVLRQICHQIPDRSFHLSGTPLPVCIRCLGGYLGFAAGMTAVGHALPGKWLGGALALTAMEWILELMFGAMPMLRFVAAVALGFAVAPAIRRGMVEMAGRFSSGTREASA